MIPPGKFLARLLQESRSQQAFVSLERVQKFFAFLQFPYNNYPIIHVAGSNGKGSVSIKIARALEKAGYKTALYTSPHLFAFEERIQVNGEPIHLVSLEEILSSLYSFAEKEQITLTFFELATCAAFVWFSQKKVDVAVVEVGLGGLLDATNVVEPILSIITSISKEHTDRLGMTKELIAEQKAGIIKCKVPVILGQRARQKAIFEKIKQMQSPVLLAPMSTGWYDLENQSTARTALSFLRGHFPLLSEENIEPSLQIRPPCRFEKKNGALFDVAHNLDGFMRLIEGIHLYFPGRKIRMVLGLSQDKDLQGCLEFLANHVGFFHLVQAKTDKGVQVYELARILSSFSLAYAVEEDLQEGVKKAKLFADAAGDLLVITGSFYLMQDAQKGLNKLSFV